MTFPDTTFVSKVTVIARNWLQAVNDFLAAYPEPSSGPGKYIKSDGTTFVLDDGPLADHGTLAGLADDDHLQYLNNVRGDNRYLQLSNASEVVDDRVSSLLVAGTNVTLVYDDTANTLTVNSLVGEGGVTDHGVLTGLADDDHTQYYNAARGDARYLQISNASETIDDRVASLLVAGTNVTLLYNDVGNTLTISASGTGGGITDHGALTGLEDDDHTQYFNTIRGDARYLTLADAPELVRDTFNSSLVPGTSIGVVYNDSLNTTQINFTGTASTLQFLVTGTISSQNVQAAIAECDTENRALSAAIVTDLASASINKGSKLVAFIQRLSGAVATRVEDKLAERVSVKDFGAVGDGDVVNTDDTAAIIAALTASKHVVVPAGMRCPISATVTIPVGTRLEFLGSHGVVSGQLPSSYFIKKASMTTKAISMSTNSSVIGGGLICAAGNSGDGICLEGNSAKLSDFYVQAAGRDGVRVGTDAGTNCNSFSLSHVTTYGNGRYGINVHDGKAAEGADANAGTLLQCFSHGNVSHGIYFGHCFWNSLVNCLTESNGGWGLYISPTLNGSVAESRYHSVIGGDYNEGNVGGPASISGYACGVYQPDPNQLLTVDGLLSQQFGADVSRINAITLTRRGIDFPIDPVLSSAATNLDEYTEYSAASTACTGAITAAVVWKLTKVGNVVTLHLPEISATCGSAISSFTFGEAIGTRFRPSARHTAVVAVKSGGAFSDVPGIVEVSTLGVIKVYLTITGGSSFALGSAAGIDEVSLSWLR